MTQFAMLHILKAKPLNSGLHAHIDRDHVPKNADYSRTKNNVYLVDDQLMTFKQYQAARSLGQIPALQKRIEDRIAVGYMSKRRIRSNTVRELDVMLTGSHERMIEMKPTELREWFVDNYRFVCQEFGKKNIVGFALHMDEATPHIHATVVPLTKDGRLSAKELLNGKNRTAPRGEYLRKMQDRYAKVMKSYGLVRGIPAEITQVKHTTTAEYYREIKCASQKIAPLKRTSLNFSKAKKQAIATLASASIELKQAETNKSESIQKAIADVRESINMIGLATQFGYKIDRLKSCRTSIQMQNDQGEQIVISRAKKGHWHYFKRGTDERGNSVDFLRAQGESWKQIIARSTWTAMSKTFEKAKPILEVIPDKIEDLQAATMIAEKLWESKAHRGSRSDYLCLHRGLDVELVKSRSEAMKSTSDSISFKTLLPSEDGNWQHCGHATFSLNPEESKTKEKKPSRKSLPKGLPKGWAFFSMGHDPRSLILVCESPIDGLSYAKLKGLKNYSVIASCGRASERQMKALQIIAQYDRPKLVLGDNDTNGQKLSEKFCQALNIDPRSSSYKLPDEGKDFNEELRIKQDRAKQIQEKPKPKRRRLSM